MRTEQSVARIEEQLRTLLEEAWRALSHQQQELDLLAMQMRSQVEREAERFAQLKPKLQALDQTLDRYSREELRQLFQAAKEREVRLVTFRTELEGLEYKRSVLAQDARILGRFGVLLTGGEPPAIAAAIGS